MQLAGSSDEELMNNIKDLSGSDDAQDREKYFNELYTRMYSQAYSFCRYYGLRHNDILDTIQETFIRVFNYSLSYKKEFKFKPWFFRILYNSINDIWKRKKLHLHENIEDSSEITGEESPQIKLFHDRHLLDSMIYKLPKYLKDCLLLYAYQDMDYKSIGMAVGISPRHARNRVDEAIRELRSIAGEYSD